MTPDQRELLLQAARNLLEHAATGRRCDPHALAWARQLLADSPPRNPPLTLIEGGNSQGDEMNREQAHELLDAAKAGVPVSKRAITTALRATGDLRRHALHRPAKTRPESPEPPAPYDATQIGGGA